MSEMKYIQTELDKHNYFDLKKTAEKQGISIKEAIREAVLEWVRENPALMKKIPSSRCKHFAPQRTYQKGMMTSMRIKNDLRGYFGFLALVNEKDDNHGAAKRFLDELKRAKSRSRK